MLRRSVGVVNRVRGGCGQVTEMCCGLEGNGLEVEVANRDRRTAVLAQARWHGRCGRVAGSVVAAPARLQYRVLMASTTAQCGSGDGGGGGE